MPGQPQTTRPPSRWESAKEFFPFGLAPLLIFVLMVISGAFLLAQRLGGPQPGTEAAGLRMWTFANIHYDAYEKARPAFEARHPGTKVDLQLVHGDAVTRRLRAAFWADLDVPDVVEVEISSAGSFFRGPEKDIGFIDLTGFLSRPDPADPDRRPLLDRIVKTRLCPYMHKGRMYGLPHDVHPVMLAYRADLFAELGIDPDKIETWDDLIREGRRITNHVDRYMLNLAKSGSESIEVLLFQRGGGYFDADGRLIMDDDLAAETVRWYIPLVAGPRRIAADTGRFGQAFAKAVQDGYTLASICPDWKSKSFEKDMPQMAGKLKLMPLPAFAKGGRRTSTWGGTMAGITRRCPDKELAWQLACHMYMDREDLGERFRQLNILPPFKDAWSHPAFHEKRPYWCGQAIGAEYIKLAEQVPPQYSSPFVTLAKSKLGEVIASCVNYYETRGPEGSDESDAFDEFVRQRLRSAGDEVRKQMTRNPF